jgi:low affinity Fe/Cu permease
MKRLNKAFTHFANKASEVAGSSWAFLVAVLAILVWAITGPLFGFSDTWQLIINTLTTLVTFLMVFLIQNTQNRDAKAIHLKLDEIVRVIGAADDELLDVEDLTEEELREMIKRYHLLARQTKVNGSAPGGRTGERSPVAEAEAEVKAEEKGEEVPVGGAAGPSTTNGRAPSGTPR